MKKLLGLFFVLFAAAATQAQTIIESLERDMPGQGVVRIYQDPMIGSLLGTQFSSSDESETIKSLGFRVQIYAGNNSRAARTEAESVAEQIKKSFPDIGVYTFFASPRWVCRVGDFRSVEEADVIMRQIRNKGDFKEVSVVKDQILIYL